jgi:hypothetical protein
MSEFTVGARVDHPRYGEGIVSENKLTSYEIFFERGGKIEITKRNTDLTLIAEGKGTSGNQGITLEELEHLMVYVLDKYQGLLPETELADKWKGGVLELKPANASLKSKEIPIDTFFHKIVMVRDRLRVLEQNINSHNALSDEEKVSLQQYITRIYGSLTSFNVLFSEKEDYFVGTKL